MLLNGNRRREDALIQALNRISGSSSDLILIQPAEGVPLQRLLDVMNFLEEAGFTSLALVDP